MSVHVTWKLLALAQAGAAVLSVNHRQACRGEGGCWFPFFADPRARNNVAGGGGVQTRLYGWECMHICFSATPEAGAAEPKSSM